MQFLPLAVLTAGVLQAATPSQAFDRVATSAGYGDYGTTPVIRFVETSGIDGFDRDFLAGGGSIRPSIEGYRRDRRDGDTALRRQGDRGYGHTSRSVVDLTHTPQSDQYGVSSGHSSVVVVAAPSGTASLPARDTPRAMRPRIVDVATNRLDRRPYGEDGLDVVHVGATKIIRISPDRPRSAGHRAEDAKDDVALAAVRNGTSYERLPAVERAVTVYPDPDAAPGETELARAEPVSPSRTPIPTPAPDARTATNVAAPPPAPASAAPTGGFEPWTEEWLRDCVARHADFDASLGTYRDETGRRRFCTGET